MTFSTGGGKSDREKERKKEFVQDHTSRGGRHALQTSSRKKSLTTQILFFLSFIKQLFFITMKNMIGEAKE
jgi:hypothetical protein